MKQVSQTNAAVIGIRLNQSTSPDVGQAEEAILKDTSGALFRIKSTISFSDKPETPQTKELSREEEQRFYKKVLKTSLI